MAPWHIIFKFFKLIWSFFCPYIIVDLFYTLYKDGLGVLHGDNAKFKQIQVVFGTIIVYYADLVDNIDILLNHGDTSSKKKQHLNFLKTFLIFIKFVIFFLI